MLSQLIKYINYISKDVGKLNALINAISSHSTEECVNEFCCGEDHFLNISKQRKKSNGIIYLFNRFRMLNGNSRE